MSPRMYMGCSRQTKSKDVPVCPLTKSFWSTCLQNWQQTNSYLFPQNPFLSVGPCCRSLLFQSTKRRSRAVSGAVTKHVYTSRLRRECDTLSEWNSSTPFATNFHCGFHNTGVFTLLIALWNHNYFLRWRNFLCSPNIFLQPGPSSCPLHIRPRMNQIYTHVQGILWVTSSA